MKRFIIPWFDLRTPLTTQQLDGAIFAAYNAINWLTIGVLTLSAKFRIQLCHERGGNFIGDAIDECCRRAKIELETQTDIIFLSVRDEFQESVHAEEPGEAEGDGNRTGEPQTHLPSFQRWLVQPSLNGELESD